MRSDLHQLLSGSSRKIGIELRENSRGVSVEAPRRNPPSVKPVISGAIRDADLMHTGGGSATPRYFTRALAGNLGS